MNTNEYLKRVKHKHTHTHTLIFSSEPLDTQTWTRLWVTTHSQSHAFLLEFCVKYEFNADFYCVWLCCRWLMEEELRKSMRQQTGRGTCRTSSDRKWTCILLVGMRVRRLTSVRWWWWGWWCCWWWWWWCQRAGPASKGIRREWTSSHSWKRRSDYRRHTEILANHTPQARWVTNQETLLRNSIHCWHLITVNHLSSSSSLSSCSVQAGLLQCSLGRSSSQFYQTSTINPERSSKIHF